MIIIFEQLEWIMFSEIIAWLSFFICLFWVFVKIISLKEDLEFKNLIGSYLWFSRILFGYLNLKLFSYKIFL
jgi:hypothetical protein